MAIAADRDGFLVGERASIDVQAYARQLAILRSLDERLADIADDTAHIRRALVTPQRSSAAGRPRDSRQAPLSVRSQVASAAPVRQRDAAVAAAIQRQEVAALRVESAARRSVSRTEGKRDSRGRFVSGGGDASPSLRAGADRLSDAAGRLKDSVSSVVDGAEELDPTIAAAKEAGAIVAPIMRPFTGMFRRLFARNDEEKTFRKTVPWYRRIVGELRDLNRKPNRGGGGSLSLGGIGGLLMKLPGIGWLGRMLGGLGGALGPLIKLASKAALPLAGIFTAAKAFNTSTEEYAARMGVELNGSMAQAMAVRFAGVLGDLGNMITFGLAGKFGELIAPHVAPAFEAVASAWGSTTSWVREKFGAALGAFDAMVGNLSGMVDKVGNWLGEQWQGVKDKAGAAVESLKSGAAELRSGAVDLKDKAVDKAAEIKGNVVDAAQNAARTITGGRYKGGSEGNRAALVEAMNGAGIKDPKEQAMFMAQMDHESGGFKTYEENLNYSAKGLRSTFGKYFKTDAEAAQYARNPEAIANKVYGGRMGNTDPGDGWKYRGRGAVQLTGKDNYTAAGKALGLDLANNPDLAKDPEVAAKVATWYWKQRNLGLMAQDGNVEGVTRKINGGTNGLADRQAKYRSYLAQAREGDLTVQTANDSRAVPPPAVSRSINTAIAPKAPVHPVGVMPMSGAAARRATPLPSVPTVLQPVGSSGGRGVGESLVIEAPLTQNVADRHIAATATGGLGMN